MHDFKGILCILNHVYCQHKVNLILKVLSYVKLRAYQALLKTFESAVNLTVRLCHLLLIQPATFFLTL